MCEICGKVFTNNQNLNRHVRTIHEKSSTSFSCTQCDYSTLQKSNLNRHLKRHTSLTSNLPPKVARCEPYIVDPHHLTIKFLIKTLNNVVLDCLQQMFPTKFDNFFMMINHGERTQIFVKFMFEIFIAFAIQKPSTDVLRYSFVTSITPIPHSLKPLPISLKISFYVKPTRSR